MPTRAYRPSALAYQLFLGSQALAEGVLTPNQLRSSAWIRLGQDVYADARLERDHALACHAVAMAMPAEAAFAGPSAAFLCGVSHAAAFSDPVHLVVPEKRALNSRRGVRVHRAELDSSDVDLSQHLACTSPERTVWDLASWLDPPASVPIIDSMLGKGLVELDGLGRYVATRRRRRNWRRVGRAVALADGRAQSPQESRLRVRLVLAGLPVPVPQFPIRVGSMTYHPDLAWPEYRVAIEYDGMWHDDPAQIHRDRRRLNQLTTAGWIVLHVTSERMRRDFAGVLTEARAALRSRGWPG